MGLPEKDQGRPESSANPFHCAIALVGEIEIIGVLSTANSPSWYVRFIDENTSRVGIALFGVVAD